MSNPVNIPALLHGANPAVQIENGTVITTSIEVARVFEKRHDDVLKSIRTLVSDLPSEHARNFAEMSIDVEIGNGATRKSPAYHLTRDGFTLLTMGFNGKKALAFKLAYIDAFNKMEAELSGRALPPPVPTRTLTFTVPEGDPWQRWLLHTDKQGRERVTPLSPDTHVTTPDCLVRMLLKTPSDLHLTPAQQHTALGALMRQIVTSAVRGSLT